MKKTYELMILNQKFVIKSDNDEREVKKVADYVNRKMHEVVSGNKATSTANVAILGALNIADDLFRQKKSYTEKIRSWMLQLDQIFRKTQ